MHYRALNGRWLHLQLRLRNPLNVARDTQPLVPDSPLHTQTTPCLPLSPSPQVFFPLSLSLPSLHLPSPPRPSPSLSLPASPPPRLTHALVRSFVPRYRLTRGGLGQVQLRMKQTGWRERYHLPHRHHHHHQDHHHRPLMTKKKGLEHLPASPPHTTTTRCGGEGVLPESRLRHSKGFMKHPEC